MKSRRMHRRCFWEGIGKSTLSVIVWICLHLASPSQPLSHFFLLELHLICIPNEGMRIIMVAISISRFIIKNSLHSPSKFFLHGPSPNLVQPSTHDRVPLSTPSHPKVKDSICERCLTFLCRLHHFEPKSQWWERMPKLYYIQKVPNQFCFLLGWQHTPHFSIFQIFLEWMVLVRWHLRVLTR